MWRRSVNPILSRFCVSEILDALVTAAPATEILDGAILRLFTNDLTPGGNTDVGDFTEATFVGYSSVTPLVWTAPVNNDDTGMLSMVQGNFIGGAIVAPGESVRGYWIENAGGTEWFIAERFEEPVPFEALGDFLSLDVVFEFQFAQSVTQ